MNKKTTAELHPGNQVILQNKVKVVSQMVWIVKNDFVYILLNFTDYTEYTSTPDEIWEVA